MTLPRQSFPECDNFCMIGVGTIDAEALLAWLGGREKRRLFLIACGPSPDHPRIQIYDPSTFLEQNIIANEVGWSAVMQPLEIQASEGWEALESRVRESHLAAHLLLSDVADLGIKAFANARENWKKSGPFAALSSFKGCLAGVPAIVAGAGPSLEEALPTLQDASSRALLIASGTALSICSRWGITPHLASALDKRTLLEVTKGAEGSISCVQSRLNPEVMALLQGTKILAPEGGPLPWESWWLGKQEAIESGNTVGNFATQIALYLGCNPIIWTGMDFCYRGEVKYAENLDQEKCHLLTVQNRQGAPVLTQRDWLMAASWHRGLAAEHTDRRWICTAQEGLVLGDAVETLSWQEALQLLDREIDAGARLKLALQEAPLLQIDPEKEAEWQRSIERSLSACRAIQTELLEKEPVYFYYLAPLWNLWRPVFQRDSAKQDLPSIRLLFFLKVLDALA